MKSSDKNIQSSEIGTLTKSIVKTLAYYDIFNYPLTKEEIYICSNTNGDTKASVFDELEVLVSSGIVYNNDKFYSIHHNSHLIPKRIEGNKRAIKKMFLLNSYKFFCINYFISTTDLEIEEKIFIQLLNWQHLFQCTASMFTMTFTKQING